jgi:hypothetical protein
LVLPFNIHLHLLLLGYIHKRTRDTDGIAVYITDSFAGSTVI